MSQNEFHFIDENGETQNVPVDASKPEPTPVRSQASEFLEHYLRSADDAGKHLTEVLANNAGQDEAEHKRHIRYTLRHIARAWGLKVTGED